MFCCCCLDQEENDNSLNSQLMKSNSQYENNIQSNVTSQTQVEYGKQILELFGNQYYALVRKTFKNINMKVYSTLIPVHLVETIVSRCKCLGESLHIFVPYADELVLLQMVASEFETTTIENNEYFIEELKKQKVDQHIKFIQKEEYKNCEGKFDISIFNLSNKNFERIFPELGELELFAKSSIFIFDYSEDTNEIIGIIMKYQKTMKGELMLISINGMNKFYILYFGKISATKFYSEKETIIKLLLEDIQETEGYAQKIEKLLEILRNNKVQNQKLIQLIQMSKGISKNDVAAQPDTILSEFLYQLINQNIVSVIQISEIFGTQYVSAYLSQTAQYQEVSHTINNFTLNEQQEDKTIKFGQSVQQSISTIQYLNEQFE